MATDPTPDIEMEQPRERAIGEKRPDVQWGATEVSFDGQANAPPGGRMELNGDLAVKPDDDRAG